MANFLNETKPLIEYFYHWENTTPDKIFLRQPFGDSWKTLTFKEAGQEARKITAALQAKGLQVGDHIGIYSKNCYHWILADLAIMMGKFVSVPYYASLTKDQLHTVIIKSDIKLIFIGKLDKWGDRDEAIPANVEVIRFPEYKGNVTTTKGEQWNDLLAKHDPIQGNPSPKLDDLWTILFTSGTTGSPKGVMHIHKTAAEIMTNEVKTNWIGLQNLKQHKYFSFLPLNHVGERIGLELPSLFFGGMVSFAESLDSFANNLQNTQPSVLFAVPRIWTKFYLGVSAKIPPKKLNRLLKIPIVSGMVKKKILTTLGLSEAEVVATGAAITPEFLKNWYKKLGLHLIEAYGMTEVCGSFTNGTDVNSPADSVGKVVPGCEVRIHEDTGEILMKSPYMMKGYYKDEEKTKEVLIDGWLHSGDKGRVDKDGFLYVVGRVKDAFKTSKGSYITPNPMEEVFAKNDFIEQCCIAGLGCPQPICLINLSEIGTAADKAEVEASLLEALKELNATVANYEKISTIIIPEETWSIDNDMLTPTLKVKRGKIDECYQKQYEQWHEQEHKIIWL